MERSALHGRLIDRNGRAGLRGALGGEDHPHGLERLSALGGRRLAGDDRVDKRVDHAGGSALAGLLLVVGGDLLDVKALDGDPKNAERF